MICSSIFFLLDHNKIVAKVKKFKVVISKIRAQSERKSKKKCLGGNKKVWRKNLFLFAFTIWLLWDFRNFIEFSFQYTILSVHFERNAFSDNYFVMKKRGYLLSVFPCIAHYFLFLIVYRTLIIKADQFLIKNTNLISIFSFNSNCLIWLLQYQLFKYTLIEKISKSLICYVFRKIMGKWSLDQISLDIFSWSKFSNNLGVWSKVS